MIDLLWMASMLLGPLAVGGIAAVVAGRRAGGAERGPVAARAPEAHATLNAEIVASAPDAILVVDSAGTLVDVNQQACRLFAYSRDELIGSTVEKLVPEAAQGRHRDQVKEYVGAPRTRRMGELRSVDGLRADGSIVPVEIGLSPVDLHGELHVIAIARDVTDQKRLLDKLERMAFYDVLTGLPNRELFRRRLEAAITHADSVEGMLGLLFIDLDGFKHVNDTFGHDVGDAFLQAVAARLTGSLRSGDPIMRSAPVKRGGGSLSRLGGDEFTILLPRLRSADDAALVARRMIRSLSEPVITGSAVIHTSASIGIAVYPMDGGNAEALLRAADSSMYQAKESGRGRYRFASRELNERLDRRARIASELRRALREDSLQLHYQPIVDARTSAIVAAEALLRWDHRELGWVNPEEIVCVSREAGLTSALGRWILETALDQLSIWKRDGRFRLRMSVNVSPDQLRSADFHEVLEGAIERSGVGTGDVELEITETAIVQEDADVQRNIAQLVKLGVALALDDFGTGYSSLSHLVQLPVRRVKIDRSFVMGLEDDPRCATIISGLVRLVRGLGMASVAEGVENLEQERFVRSCGCDELQGFLFARARDAAEFERLLESDASMKEGAGAADARAASLLPAVPVAIASGSRRDHP